MKRNQATHFFECLSDIMSLTESFVWFSYYDNICDMTARLEHDWHYFFEEAPYVNLFLYFCKISCVLVRLCICTKL